MRRPTLRALPLFWKILVPFMTLLILVGVFGAFLIVRTLSSRAQDELDRDLSRRSLEVRSTLRDVELSLLESATLAANLEGMADAVRARDVGDVRRLARSVLALKTDLGTVAVVHGDGTELLEVRPSGNQRRSPRAWERRSVVARALTERTARRHAGLVGRPPNVGLVIAAPICTETPACAPVGVAVLAVPLEVGVAAAEQAAATDGSVAIYDAGGRLLAEGGAVPAATRIDAPPGDMVIRRLMSSGGGEVATLIGPYEVQDRVVGRIALTIPSAPAFATARQAALRLGVLLAAAMAGVVGLGALISRHILAQVRSLVEVNQALESGDLTARAPILVEDELGALAHGVNSMAAKLEETYDTLEARVSERTAEVLRLLQERTDFFAAVSHELRTPLAVIIAKSEMMRDPTVRKTQAWSAETGAAIGDSASQLLALVNDILDVARGEAGRLVVTPQDLDLAELLASVRPSIEGLTRAGDIETTMTAPDGLGVRADPLRVREIVMNLVGNAVKYTPPGGSVDVSATHRPGGVVEVIVSDTGIGIPAEVGDRIFEPFYRVSGSEPHGGQASSGLGLALARHLVEAHGGTIGYTSDPARGSTFAFTLPSAAVKARSGPGSKGRA